MEAATYSHSRNLGAAVSAVKMAAPAVSVTNNHSVGIHEDGTVYAVGYNWSGSVSSVDGLTNKLHAAAINYATIIQNGNKTLTGYGQTAAFGSQAILDSWGTPDVKQITGGQDWTAILLEDGTVKATNVGMDTATWMGVVSICGGDYHLLGLKADGTIYSAISDGKTISGDVVTVTSGWSDVVLLATSDDITFALKDDGTFVKNTSSSQTLPAGWDAYGDVIDIACTWGQLLIVRVSGLVEIAGTDSNGVFGEVAEWKYITRLAAGSGNSVILGLRTDGLVPACGDNTNDETETSSWDLIAGENISSGGGTGQATSDTIVTRPAAMWKDHLVAINLDGTCVGCGATTNNQIAVTNWTDIFQLATADRLTVGLKADGTCVTTGLDWGSSATSTPPTWADIIFIACGNQSVFGIDTNGDIFACGADSGQGEVTDATAANGFVELIEIAAGKYHCIGLKSDGTCVGAGYDYNGLITAAESWTDIIHIESQGNVLIGVKSDGTAVYGGEDTYATKAIVEALTNVARVFVDQAYESWVAIRNDGTAINGGHSSFRDTIQDWTDVEWGAAAQFFSWGWSPSRDQCWSTNSDYSNVAGTCAEALTGLKEPNPTPSAPQTVFFGSTVSHSTVFGVPILPVMMPVAQTYIAIAIIHDPTFTLPTSAPTFTHSHSCGVPIVGFVLEASTRSHIPVNGIIVPSSWVETFSQPTALSAAEAILTKLTALTFSQPKNFPAALGFESRDVFAGSLSKCYLEDSAGKRLAALSIDIQYSGRNSTVHMVMSLPFAAGKVFILGGALPFFIKSNGDPVFKIGEFETSEYVGGASKSYLLTVKTFAVIRLPGEITTPPPTRISALTSSLSMDIPDAFDIIPGDILTAGKLPQFVVSAASIHIKDNESRSVVYG
ncbi:MAG: hypothetical protein QM483_09990 [Desulfuromusa sp.]